MYSEAYVIIHTHMQCIRTGPNNYKTFSNKKSRKSQIHFKSYELLRFNLYCRGFTCCTEIPTFLLLHVPLFVWLFALFEILPEL